jgi:transposase
MKRASYLQEIRTMRFTQSYEGWQSECLTQAQAAEILGVCERSFRRYVDRYEDGGGLQALSDRRLNQASRRRAPLSESIKLADMYRSSFASFNVRHFHEKYQQLGGVEGQVRSYSWVKSVLQGVGLVGTKKVRGKHRIKRQRKPLQGMTIRDFPLENFMLF